MAKIFVVFFACLMDLPCYNLYHVAVIGLRVLALSIVKTQINAFIYLPIYLLFLIYLKKKSLQLSCHRQRDRRRAKFLSSCKKFESKT